MALRHYVIASSPRVYTSGLFLTQHTHCRQPTDITAEDMRRYVADVLECSPAPNSSPCLSTLFASPHSSCSPFTISLSRQVEACRQDFRFFHSPRPERVGQHHVLRRIPPPGIPPLRAVDPFRRLQLCVRFAMDADNSPSNKKETKGRRRNQKEKQDRRQKEVSKRYHKRECHEEKSSNH